MAGELDAVVKTGDLRTYELPKTEQIIMQLEQGKIGQGKIGQGQRTQNNRLSEYKKNTLMQKNNALPQSMQQGLPDPYMGTNTSTNVSVGSTAKARVVQLEIRLGNTLKSRLEDITVDAQTFQEEFEANTGRTIDTATAEAVVDAMRKPGGILQPKIKLVDLRTESALKASNIFTGEIRLDAALARQPELLEYLVWDQIQHDITLITDQPRADQVAILRGNKQLQSFVPNASQPTDQINPPADQSNKLLLVSHSELNVQGKAHVDPPRNFRGVTFLDPTEIPVHASWLKTGLHAIINRGPPPKLQLNALTPQLVQTLSANQLRTLMMILDKVEVQKAQLTKADGQRITGPSWMVSLFGDSPSAATILAARMWGSGDPGAFAKVFAANPTAILPFLNKAGTRVLTVDNIQTVIRTMQTSGGRMDPSEIYALGKLVSVYLEKHAGSDPDKILAAVNTLIKNEPFKSAILGDRDAQFSGTMLGILVSGMLHHFDKIDADVETRKTIINGTISTIASIVPHKAAGAVGSIATTVVSLIMKAPNNQFIARQFKGFILDTWKQIRGVEWTDRAQAQMLRAIWQNGQDA